MPTTTCVSLSSYSYILEEVEVSKVNDQLLK